VVGVLRGGGDGDRVIALRADLDALPVQEASGEAFASTVVDTDYPGGPFPVAHACGHVCHTAMLMGAASALAAVRDRLPGTVLFVFQPTEKGPPLGEDGGAQAMEDAGALSDPSPSMVFGIHVGPHPTGYIAYRAGNQYASSVLVRIKVTGKQVHGSTPWMGVDPMPVAAAIINETGQLYRQLPAYDPFTVTIGHVEDEGRFNIIGESVTLYGTIRASIDRDMTDLQDRVRRLATKLAEAQGCTPVVDYLQHVPALTNRPE
jgi:amidohydrolase